MRRRRATVATLGEWQCKTGGVRWLAVANGPNIFQTLLVIFQRSQRRHIAVRLYRMNAYTLTGGFACKLECVMYRACCVRDADGIYVLNLSASVV